MVVISGDLEMEFQFEISLRRMSMFAYALSLWKTKEMQRKLKLFYYPYGRPGKMKFLEELVDEVVGKIDNPFIPVALRSELIEVVMNIAYKSYDWFNFIRRRKVFRDQSRMQLYDKFCKDIYWTHYGTIDEVKIFKYSWMNIPDVDLIKLFVMACYLCLEEFIADLWDKISKRDLDLPYFELVCRDGFHLVFYWSWRLGEIDLEGLINDCFVFFSTDHGGIYDVTKSVEVNMLRLCVKKGYGAAFKYFWNKLDNRERNENGKPLMAYSLDLYLKKLHHQVYKREQYAQIVFFLMDYMNEQQVIDLFQKNETGLYELEHTNYCCLEIIFQMCIEMWPWQDFFRLLFDKLGNFISQSIYKFIVRNLIYHSEDKKNIYFQNMLYPLWNKIPDGFKSDVIKDYDIKTLLKMGNISCLKLILCDENLLDRRNEMIKKLHSDLQTLMRKNEFDRLHEFMNKILVPVDWEKNRQKILKSVYGSLLKGEILANDSVAGLLEEEIKILKSAIDSEIMCYYFIIRNEFTLADEFLNWKYEDEGKVKKFKSDFQESNFVLEQINFLWKIDKENVESAKLNLDQFLLWLLEDEKEVNSFKEKKIFYWIFYPDDEIYDDDNSCLDEEFFEGKPSSFSFWHGFIDSDHLDILDFLRWINLDDEGIQKFKKTVCKRDFPIIIRRFLKMGEFRKIDKICKWAFDSDDEMYDFLEKILLSYEGIGCCKLYISKYSDFNMLNPKTEEELKTEFKNFVNLLMRSLKNFDEFKGKFRNWIEDSEEQFGKIDSDEGSTERTNSDLTDSCEEQEGIYCDKDKYKLFLRLLDEVDVHSGVL